jgi:hypothetical protein
MKITENYINKIKSLLTPVEFPDLQRYGGRYDGGYILSKRLTDESDTVYSLGVGPVDQCISFDKEMAQNQKTVYLYDGSVNFWDNRKEFFFKKEFIDSQKLEKIVSENNHFEKTNILLKMDIEGAEFETIINSNEDVFKHFNQFTVEVHDILFSSQVEDLEYIKQNSREEMKFAFFEKINKFYNLVHIHGNNYSKTISNGICDCLELTYIRKDEFNYPINVLKKTCPIKELDFPNNVFRQEVEMNWWIS